MRKDELFINGQLVDLDDNTKVTLNYKSNIFSDLSKIVSNNSYTIKLPNTVHNQCVIEHADLPACETEYPRYMHRCRYLRNGVEIIKDALGVLLSTGEAIELALTWGNVSVFNNLVNDGRALNELMDKGQSLVWGESQVICDYDAVNDYFYSEIYGSTAMRTSQGAIATTWHHPCARVEWLLSLIEEAYGVNINIPAPYRDFVRRLVVLCHTRKESDAVMRTNPVKFSFVRYNKRANGTRGGYFEFAKVENSTQADYGEVKTINDSTLGADYSAYYGNRDMDSALVKLDVLVEMSVSGLAYDDTYITVTQGIGDNSRSLRNSTVGIAYGKKVADNRVKYSIEVGAAAAENTYFYLACSTPAGYMVLKVVSFDFSITLQATRDIQYGELFPIIGNLPDIKVIDFLKNITSLCGFFAVPDENDRTVMNLTSMELLLKNKSKAQDWTRQVLANTWENKPMAMTYALDGFAQRNKLLYKDDASVLGSYNGELVVYDNTIEGSRDAVILKFAASDTYDGMAKIPLYAYEEEEYTLQKIEPRILLEMDNDGKSALTFAGLEWPALVESFYAGYQKVIAKPKIIKEKIELSEVALSRLDMTVPIYLAQYGRYYAIISIKAEDTGICECQLLQLQLDL